MTSKTRIAIFLFCQRSHFKLYILLTNLFQIMKHCLAFLVLGTLASILPDAQAQSRDLGAQRIVLDDGNGTGTMTITYEGPGNFHFILPPGEATAVPTGTLAGQTLAWNGEDWVAMDNLLNNSGAITITGDSGSLFTTTNSGTSGYAGSFQLSNEATESSALEAATSGPGVAMKATAMAGVAGLFSGAVGIRIDQGSLIGSSTTYSLSDGDFPLDRLIVHIPDDGIEDFIPVILPDGTEGQILIVTTDDAEGVDFVGQPFFLGSYQMRTLVYTNGSWFSTP